MFKLTTSKAEITQDQLLETARFALPKWPALVVGGERVSREQAQEILIRTDDWDHFTNDHEFRSQILTTVGIPFKVEHGHVQPDWEHMFRAGLVVQKGGAIGMETLVATLTTSASTLQQLTC